MTEVSREDTLKSDKAKTDFISSISHELRSPLHGILGSAEMLREGSLELRQSDLLQGIETCGKTLLDTVDHLLDFTKINNFVRPRQISSLRPHHERDVDELGRLSTVLDLTSLCEEAIDTMSAGHNFARARRSSQGHAQGMQIYHCDWVYLLKPVDLRSPRIALCLEVAAHELSSYRCEAGALKRLLCNLIGNSLKYTDTGYIALQLKVRPSADQRGKDEVIFTVSDSGRGISQQYLADRLYTPFAQENP